MLADYIPKVVFESVPNSVSWDKYMRLRYFAYKGNPDCEAQVMAIEDAVTQTTAEFSPPSGDYTSVAFSDVSESTSTDGEQTPFVDAQTTDAPPVDDVPVDVDALPDGLQLTSAGNAELFSQWFSDRARYCPEINSWLLWDGRRWKADTSDEILLLAKDLAVRLFEQAANIGNAKQSTELANWAKASLSGYRVNEMLRFAKPLMSISQEELDTHDFLLNVSNGVVNMKTGELLPHDPKLFITYLVDVVFDPDAECPKFEAFMEMILPDPEVRHFVQKMVGYSFTGNVDEDAWFFLHGGGANGKSTFIKTIDTMLGGYFQRMNLDALVVQKMSDGGKGANSALAALRGKRFVAVSEIQEGKRFNEALIKDLTGGESIATREVYSKQFTMRPTYHLWLYGQHKPIFRDTSVGQWRRANLIPFEVTIPEDKQRRRSEMIDEFVLEFPGILNWVVLGCCFWQSEGLQQPDKVKVATEEYQTEMDILKQFIADECIVAPFTMVSKDDLYKAFHKWLEDSGEKFKPSKRWIGIHMKELGYHVGGRGDTSWVGLGLVASPQQQAVVFSNPNP